MATLGFRTVTGMVVLVGALFSSTSHAQQACDRACLTKVIDGYFAALSQNVCASFFSAPFSVMRAFAACGSFAESFATSAAK